MIIMDEAHNLGDESRGSKFELVLAAAKQKMKEANFLLLSPFISNADEIGEWLADSKKKFCGGIRGMGSDKAVYRLQFAEQK